MHGQVDIDRVVQLLGQNIPAVHVASAVRCSESYISQLVADPEIAKRISDIRYAALTEANKRDEFYDELEDKAAAQLARVLPTMVKPQELLKAVQVLNSLKRRGSQSPAELSHNDAQQVTLVLSNTTINNFTLNANKQVIGAGEQNLVTATLKQVEDIKKKGAENESQ